MLGEGGRRKYSLFEDKILIKKLTLFIYLVLDALV